MENKVGFSGLGIGNAFLGWAGNWELGVLGCQGTRKALENQAQTHFVPSFPVPGERRYIYEKET
jgi:hypothetical protein